RGCTRSRARAGGREKPSRPPIRRCVEGSKQRDRGRRPRWCDAAVLGPRQGQRYEPRGLGGEQCQIKHCVLNATARERLPAQHVVALAKNPSQVFQLATLKNAAELAAAAARFAVVRAKSKISRHNRPTTANLAEAERAIVIYRELARERR